MSAKLVSLVPAAPPEKPDSRAELRRLITEQKARDAEIFNLKDALARAERAIWTQAVPLVEEANATLGKAKAAQASGLMADLRSGGAGAGDATGVRNARAALVEADDGLAALRTACKELESEIVELGSESYARELKRATQDLLVPEALKILERALQSLMTLRSQKAALFELMQRDWLAPEIKDRIKGFVLGEQVELIRPLCPPSLVPAPQPGCPEFQAAMHRLKTDADTEIPKV